LIRRVSPKFAVLLTRFGSQGTRILATFVLARLVSKEDYGLYGQIYAIPGLLAAAGDLGISRSVVINPHLPEEEVRDTALVLMLAIAVILAAAAIGGGWYFDVREADPRLRWVGLLVAGTYLFQGVQSVQLALLARDLRFVRWAGVEVLTTAATAATGVVVALSGGGIFALATQQLVAAILGLAVTMWARPVRWPRRFRRETAKGFLSFGWKASLYQYVNNVQANVANLLIGGLAGNAAVGIYGRATQVRDLLGQNLVTTFDLVLSPLFARARDDAGRLRGLYLRGTVGVTAFLAFGGVWLAVTADDLIRVVLGPGWAEVPALVQALSIGLALMGVGYTGLLLALALGQPLVNFAYAMVTLAGLAVAAGVFSATDLWTFALVQSLFAVVPVMYITRWACHAAGTSARQLLRRITPVFLVAGAAGGLMWALRLALGDLEALGTPGLALRIAVVSAAGGSAGWALMRVFDRDNYRDLVGLVIRPAHAAE
jgi:O-antigen/teichoic acid export membrane protein